MSTANSGILDAPRIDVRFKISALWIAMLFLFAYGDIFGFFRPGQIEEVSAGEISGFEITQGFLFAVSVYIAIASAMVFLSLVLRPSINRWATSCCRSCTASPSLPRRSARRGRTTGS
jgi:hypothetical protein